MQASLGTKESDRLGLWAGVIPPPLISTKKQTQVRKEQEGVVLSRRLVQASDKVVLAIRR
jgi:hypothetical protein